MLSFSHVSVKTNTQQSLASCCVDRLSCIKSSLFSRERTFESMSVGRAGLVGLALSLARIPPRLLRFRPLCSCQVKSVHAKSNLFKLSLCLYSGLLCLIKAALGFITTLLQWTVR